MVPMHRHKIHTEMLSTSILLDSFLCLILRGTLENAVVKLYKSQGNYKAVRLQPAQIVCLHMGPYSFKFDPPTGGGATQGSMVHAKP